MSISTVLTIIAAPSNQNVTSFSREPVFPMSVSMILTVPARAAFPCHPVFEIDLRTIIASAWGSRHGAFGHRNRNNFFRSFAHADWLTGLQGETIRSREFFVKHYRETYQEYPDLPVWMAVEIMPMRWLSAMFSGMKRPDQEPILARYEVSPVISQAGCTT